MWALAWSACDGGVGGSDERPERVGVLPGDRIEARGGPAALVLGGEWPAWRMGDLDGAATPVATYEAERGAVLLPDLDGDGVLDVLGRSYERCFVYSGRDRGEVRADGALAVIEEAVEDAVPCSLDGDGRLDLCTPFAAWSAVERGGAPAVRWEVDGTRIRAQVEAGDADGDGLDEVFTGLGTEVFVQASARSGDHDLRADADAILTLSPLASDQQVDLRATDLDGDGRADLVVTSDYDRTVWLVTAPLAGGPVDAAPTAVDVPTQFVTTPDADLDGVTDLALRLGDEVLVFLGPIAPGRRSEGDADLVVSEVGFPYALADLDDDGVTDLVHGSLTTEEALLLRWSALEP